MKNSSTLFKQLFIFLINDINELLPKHYPEHFHNNLSLLGKQEIRSKSSKSLATISAFLPVTLCL